jgi:hypothetical protein
VIRVLLAKKEDLSRRGAIKFCQGAVVIDSTPVDPALRPLKNNRSRVRALANLRACASGSAFAQIVCDRPD